MNDDTRLATSLGLDARAGAEEQKAQRSTRPPLPSDAPAEQPRYYLLVLDGSTASVVYVSPDAPVFIGRGEEATLQLLDPSVSRIHARLEVNSTGARIADFKSHNGTRVNGERLTDERSLQPGDVISLGTTTIVFHRDVVQFSRRRMLAAGPFRERLEEEIERTKRHQRPVSLLAIAVGETTSEVRTRLGEAATAQLRLLDAVCWDGERHLLLLFPEVTREQAPVPSERILRALRQVHPELRAGFAVCPEDGCTPADLIDSACAAARGARTGELCSASATTASVKIGALRVVSVAPATVGVFKLAERLAATELPVLVSGETGVGKDLVAAALHAWSRRKDGPLVAINCAALPESLAESELFGYERGAFTGADAAKRGLFESAAGGVVFLDEVGELPLTVQAKLLRVLETRRALRIGGLKEIPLDVRIVSATNRSLQEEVTAGRFRGDLYYRLSAATIAVPALRERLEDVPLLARMFLEESCTQAGRALLQLSPEVNALLSNHDWPGNVRELKNLIDYVAATTKGDVVERADLPQLFAQRTAPAAAPSAGAASFRNIYDEIRALESARIAEALQAAGGVQTRAAELIGMPLRTFVAKVKLYRLSTVRRA